MYFKQRENSPLYQHYRKVQQARLSKRIDQIKNHKSKNRDSIQRLPPITHRASDQKLYQKKMVLAETDRLNKKVSELKSSPSAYFSKVIGINNSIEAAKLKKQSRKDGERTNHSTVIEKTDQALL